jgi:hypothetical protein
MRTEYEVVDPVSVEIDSQDLKVGGVARRRTCGHVVMLFFHRGVRRRRRETCVLRGENSQYSCLYV